MVSWSAGLRLSSRPDEGERWQPAGRSGKSPKGERHGNPPRRCRNRHGRPGAAAAVVIQPPDRKRAPAWPTEVAERRESPQRRRPCTRRIAQGALSKQGALSVQDEHRRAAGERLRAGAIDRTSTRESDRPDTGPTPPAAPVPSRSPAEASRSPSSTAVRREPGPARRAQPPARAPPWADVHRPGRSSRSIGGRSRAPQAARPHRDRGLLAATPCPSPQYRATG